MKDLVILGLVAGAYGVGRLVQFFSDARSSLGKGRKDRGR
jgi:hypothetical protein